MEKIFDQWNWVRDLVKTEEQMEETGVIDLSTQVDEDKALVKETFYFLHRLKNEFIEATQAFNSLKTSPLGRIKIYGIAKTEADFMLFRNGFKMIFSFKNPGMVSIRFNFFGPQYLPNAAGNQSSAAQLMEEHLVETKKGPFHDITWTFQDQPFQIPALVKYHLTLFIRESAK